MKNVIIYLCAISFIAIICTITDKLAAINHKQRIRERTLIIIGALGGAMAMYLTMKLIRHKTRHMKFMIGLPLIIAVQIISFALVVQFLFK